MQDTLTKKRLIISVVIFIAIVLAFTVKFVIDNKQTIHPRTVSARNYIMKTLIKKM